MVNWPEAVFGMFTILVLFLFLVWAIKRILELD
jgi:flagellar biogenesis protein FliO